MNDDAVQVSAECLNISLELARTFCRTLDDDLTLVWTDLRGKGGVLVGPDGSALYLAGSVSPDEGVAAYRSGTRTAREQFSVFAETRPTRSPGSHPLPLINGLEPPNGASSPTPRSTATA